MKKIILSILTLLFFLPLHAQNDADGDPLQMGKGLSPKTTNSLADGETNTIPAGDDIEGDYIGEMKFDRSGDKVWVLNRITDNITVIDFASQEIVQNIPVGAMPMDIGFSDDLAVVACYSSNEVWFINTDDYSVAAIETVAEQPAKVHVGRAGNVAVIGCDGSDVAEVFDLNSLSKTLTINGFPVYLYKFSFITSNPRNSVYYSNFRITDDEAFVVNGADETGLKFWDLATGQITATIPEAGDCGQIELSGDGEKVIAMKAGDPGTVTQVEVASQSFLTQISMPGVNVFSTYSPPAVSMDGNRALVPSNPGNTAFLDFETGTWEHIGTGNTPDWVGSSEDGAHFIAGDYFIAVIDAGTGEIESSMNGISIQNGAVGPGKRIVASDPLRDESVLFYEFENPADLNLLGGSATGSELEADATYSVKITPDGQRVLAANSLSGSLSIIDVETESVVAIVPLGSSETFHVDVTSDSRFALIAKRLENKVAIVDLQTNEMVADVPSGGSKPDQVYVLPGDEYAYAINAGGGDNIGVIALDGENSVLESVFPIGNTGISWTNYGIRADLKFTPDGSHALLANPFDEQVQVIDLAEHEVVANIPVEGFPLQIAIAPDPEFGNFAGVTLKSSGELAILAGEGNNWSLVGKYACASNPVRVDYDPGEHAMWVTSSEEGKTQMFSLSDLQFVGEGTFSTITPIAVRNAATGGLRFTLTRSSDTDQVSHQLHVNSDTDFTTYDLPSLPIHHFDIAPDGSLAAISHPASDEVTLFKETVLGFEQVVVSLKAPPYLLFPNPVTDALYFRLEKRGEAIGEIDFRLFDMEGKLCFEKHLPGGKTFSVSRQKKWVNGTYFYEIKKERERLQSGKVVLK